MESGSDPDRTVEFVEALTGNERPLRAFIRSLVPDTSAADDVFQETCRVMWRRFDTFEPGTNFAAWACRIAFHKVLDLRKKQSSSRVEYSTSLVELLAEDCMERLERAESRYRALQECFSRLDDRDRDLVRRRYEEGASVRSVAEALGRPIEGLYKVYQRIRRNLLECVETTLEGAT